LKKQTGRRLLNLIKITIKKLVVFLKTFPKVLLSKGSKKKKFERFQEGWVVQKD
jgi:hypothetical protein